MDPGRLDEFWSAHKNAVSGGSSPVFPSTFKPVSIFDASTRRSANGLGTGDRSRLRYDGSLLSSANGSSDNTRKARAFLEDPKSPIL